MQVAHSITERWGESGDVDRRPVLAFFNRRFHSVYGAQANAIRLARLCDQYAHVIVLTTSEGNFKAKCDEENVRCEILKTPRRLRVFGGEVLRFSVVEKISLAWEILRFNFVVLNAVRRMKVDAIVSVDAQSIPFLLVARWIARVPLLVYVQGDDTGRFLRKVVGACTDRIMVIANALRPSFESSWPSCRNRISTLYSGFPIPMNAVRNQSERELFCSEHQIPKHATIIGLVGTLVARKGADLLVRAAPEILRERSDCYFVLFGDEPPGHESFRAEVEELIRQLNLSERFVFAGFCRHEKIFNTVDLLALPSRSEGLPSVLIEAIARGLPVVASDIAGANEIVCSDSLGSLVPPNNSGALAAAIIDQLSVPQTIEVKELRRSYALGKFSEVAYLESFVEILGVTGVNLSAMHEQSQAYESPLPTHGQGGDESDAVA
jgi:glycosyltransferase involved in cell wall biosynthesis